MHEVFKLVTKANRVIEQAVKKFPRFCHMLYIDYVNEFLHFDYRGKLTDQGKTQLWKEVDENMKNFDKGYTDLKPREDYAYQGPRGYKTKMPPKAKHQINF